MIAGAIAVTALALRLPYQEAAAIVVKPIHSVAVRQDVQVAATVPPASDPLWHTPLRRPLQDAPDPVVAATSGTPFASHLTGTFVEAGRSVAVFVGTDGRSALKAVGEDVDGARVVDIAPRRVLVDYAGQRLELVLPETEGL